ncbi:DNA polymerase III subunit alpha, partial [Candidatus Marinamargulisbacteria bacterium SCGC AG-414-C22]
MSQSFVHLHCHSEYSILECPIRMQQLINQAKEYGMPALALTDNATMYGAIEFYQKAKHAGINPIIGADVYLASDITVKERWSQRLVLLCQNFEGYQNLIKLISKAHLDGFYYKPRLDFKTIEEHADGLIAISPSRRGPVSSHIETHNDEQALAVAKEYQRVFGDRFYLGMQRIDGPYEELVQVGLQQISADLNIPIVATNDVYYLKQDDSVLRDILFCVQTGKQLEDDARAKFQNEALYFKSPDEMAAVFADHPEYLQCSVDIANRCHLEIEMETVLLPHFKCPDNKSSEVYLEELVWEGIDTYYSERTDEIVERVKFELDIINKMKYPNYFLIIYDFLFFCVDNNIPVGPGRGSAAGSIVAYALGITKLDPIKYNLLFERFLNPERVSMPDIDIDFCIKRRTEVIDYILHKYGQECVSQIITFGTMQGRAVIRDVGRVLNVPLADVDRIAKLVPSTPGTYVSIPEALEQVPELKKLYDSTPEFKELLDYGTKLEGVKRHTSTHAAGVVISRDHLDTVVPLTSNDGQVATQYAMADIESIGLLKMDILGLRNLTVIEDAVRLIRDRHQNDFNIDDISIEDKATYDHLCSGRGVGVFQLESRGMRQLMKDMQPRVFEDVIALLALYRPGPLGSGMVSDFVSNKLGKTEVKYPIDALEPILKETYGMIVYQEQVMQIASVIGGFSLGQADMLRRAMGKKKKDVMDKMREDFLDGAREKEFDAKKARDVFELCYKFAEYGFNKSHSTAYALISFQTGYLKANFTVEYMAALLSSVVSNSDKTSMYIHECQDIGIPVLAPSVNESKYDFTVIKITENNTEKEAIRFGLGAIKNVGDGAIESIIAEGPYKDLADFCMKVDLKQCNKRVLESLIKSGAMDMFGERSYLLAVFEAALESAQVLVRERSNGQVALFSDDQAGVGLSMDSIRSDDFRIFSKQEMLRMEKDMLGLYISGHPLDIIKDQLEKADLSVSKINEEKDGKFVTITGFVTNVRRIITKNKREMLSGTLEDFTGSLTVLIFQNDRFEEMVDLFRDDNIVTLTGRARLNQDEVTITCQDLQVLERVSDVKSYYIDAESLENDQLKQLQFILKQFKGTVPVYFKVQDHTIVTHRRYWVTEDDNCKRELETILGRGRMWMV